MYSVHVHVECSLVRYVYISRMNKYHIYMKVYHCTCAFIVCMHMVIDLIFIRFTVSTMQLVTAGLASLQVVP
jgi:hypothetical protein